MSDSANNDRAYIFRKGERLLVELKVELIFEGDYESGSDDRIDLVNSVLYPNITTDSKVYVEILSFPRKDITSIRRFKEDTTPELVNSDVFKIIPINRYEFQLIFTLPISYMYLEMKNDQYDLAVNFIKAQEIIGVVGCGTKYLISDGLLNYLVVSTSTKVFIFDLYSLGGRRVPTELKELFSIPSIAKVMHDSLDLIHGLFKDDNSPLNNLFDTAMADSLICEERTGNFPSKWRSISECLADYFNFPYSLLENNICMPNWEQRPLSHCCCVKAGFLAVYLILLKTELAKIMSKSDMDSVEKSSNSLRV